MKCQELEVRALDYLDGTLAHPEREAVERHLSACAACAERAGGFREVSRLMDEWKGIQPSVSFDARLEQRILAQPAGRGGWRTWFALPFLHRPHARPALAGAMLAVLLVAVVLVRYLPSPAPSELSGPQDPPLVATISEGSDELALYQDLPVLENWELLNNFEVLQELNRTTP